jgi:hypothetical protein
VDGAVAAHVLAELHGRGDQRGLRDRTAGLDGRTQLLGLLDPGPGRELTAVASAGMGSFANGSEAASGGVDDLCAAGDPR